MYVTGTTWQSQFSPTLVGPQNELKPTRFGSKSFYPMAHLSGPVFIV